jgi:hypothetical protein
MVDSKSTGPGAIRAAFHAPVFILTDAASASASVPIIVSRLKYYKKKMLNLFSHSDVV